MADPVIILAPPRSFTSVVCAMLGQHPQLYGLPEVNLFIAETMREREGILQRPAWSRHGLLRAIAELMGGEQTAETVLLAQRWLEMRADCSCAAVFDELSEAVGGRRLVEKSPKTVTRVEYLERTLRSWPDARYIHLIRHPRSQGKSVAELGGKLAADSLGALDYGTDPPTPDYQKAWYQLNVNIVVFLRGVPAERQVRIRGEDLLAKPERHLRDLGAWLEISNEDDAVEDMLHPEESPFADFGPLNARFGNDPKFLEAPALRRSNGEVRRASLEGPVEWREDDVGFSPEVEALAREFGYE